jgi:DNA replication protein DnaC
MNKSLEIETRQEHCPKHGEFRAEHCRFLNTSDYWSGCPVCLEESRRERQLEQWKSEVAERIRSLIDKIGIPLRFQSKNLDNFEVGTEEQRRALAVARDYVSNFAEHLKAGRCLIFLGGVGCGKTHLALGIARAIVEASPVPEFDPSTHRTFGRNVRYSTVQDVIRALRETWDRNSKTSEREILDRFCSPTLLILDEVGIQFGSEIEKNQLFEVINTRYNAQRPTVIISNLDLRGVTAYLGERVVDRLRENGGKVVIFDWESHRGRNAN